MQKIDHLTYSYFDLSEDEITLIEDTVEHVLPAVQPNAGAYPSLWKPSERDDRHAYSNRLAASLLDWFEGVATVSIEMVGRNRDFGILRLRLEEGAVSKMYTECEEGTFKASLDGISEALEKPIDRNFQLVPDMRVFANDSLYLIKPMQRRFWLQSAALDDADGIAYDLQTAKETQRRWSLAS